jgi:hypothetical protein
MKNSLLILAGAAALSLASCSQEKKTEVTAVPADGTTTTTTTTTTAPMSDADIQARAQRIADKMAANMKITDEATKTKIRTVYVNRYKRMNEMRTKYGTDTTGMAASMRDSNMSTDTEFKSVFTDPKQYQAYETSRTTYYDEDNAPMSNTSSGMSSSDTTGSMPASNMSSTSTDNMSGSADMGGTSVSKMKAKAEDGSKIKVKENGKVKTKDADGTKVKN